MALTKIAAKPNSNKVNKNKFYLNYNKMNALKNDMIKQLNAVSLSFTNMKNLTNKMDILFMVHGEMRHQLERVTVNLSGQALNTKYRIHNLKNRLTADITIQKTQMLERRLAELQKIVARLKNY